MLNLKKTYYLCLYIDHCRTYDIHCLIGHLSRSLSLWWCSSQLSNDHIIYSPDVPIRIPCFCASEFIFICQLIMESRKMLDVINFSE